MAMTKNIRTTINTVSKLFAVMEETHIRMATLKNTENINETIEASKALSNFSKRVDRLCAKLGFDREVVDEVFRLSAGCEDTFVLHILSINDYAFSAYSACATEDATDDFGTSDTHPCDYCSSTPCVEE